MLYKYKILLLLLVWLQITNLHAQQVYERDDLEINYFLSSMSQKGYLEWNDLIYPITKEKITKALLILDTKVYLLNQLEKKELQFYLQEYLNKRKQLVYQYDSSFSLHIDPILTGSYHSGSGINYKQSSIGVSIWGNVNKNLGYQFSFQDINLNGSKFDTSSNSNYEQSARGIVALNDPNIKQQLNYTDLRASIMYQFKKGSISVGQDALTWGYGENGQLVLSNHAPYYPYIRLDYEPLPWLTFNYTHAFLQSNIIDSANIYPIPSRVFPASREVFIKKYMASHSIDFRLRKGLHLSLGESIIYNDQLQVGYLLPIMFFKAYDNFINKGIIQAGSNGQFFGQLSSKNLVIPKSQLYTTLFIDEIRLSSVFDATKSRNQIGFNFGFIKQDLFVSNLIFGFEYTRLNPFLYRNFLPAQNYTSNGYILGEWVDANSDKILVFLKYSPIPKLKTYLRYQEIRKGPLGTMQDQYFGQPQMPFMQTVVFKQKTLNFKASYAYSNRLLFNLDCSNFTSYGNQYTLGFSYGL